MRSKVLVSAVTAVLLLNISGLALVDTRKVTAKMAQTTRLVGLLPASDAVAVFDAQRFFNDALPKVLSSNQPMLSEVTTRINAMQNRTGIDLRKFEQVAVGIQMKQVSPTEVDFEPVALASGDINAAALIAVAKMASKGTYREEKIGTRTVYVISPKDVIQKSTVTPNNSKIANMMDKALNGLSNDVAVTTLDKNTLVMGSLPRVKETLEASSRVSTELSNLLSVKETSVMSFAVKPPGGMSKLVPLEGDLLGNTLDSMQFVSGSLDVDAAGAGLHIAGRTSSPAAANELKDSLEGLAAIGKMFLGSSKRADQKIYARMLGNAKLVVRGSDVNMDLLVPQTDIDVLLAGVR